MSIPLYKIIKGRAVWKRNIDCTKRVFIISEFDPLIMKNFSSAVQRFLILNGDENTELDILYADERIRNYLNDADLQYHFAKINTKEMDDLVQYVLATNMHHGISRNSHVKMVSFKYLYGKQLELIIRDQLADPKSLITEMILNKE